MAADSDSAPVTWDSIDTWNVYVERDLTTKVSGNFPYSHKAAVNRKVALWYGDVTTLAIDAIVNPAAKAREGGQINKIIMEKAGEEFKREAEKNIKKPGEVFLLEGYNLPAKYVLNAFAPTKTKPTLLRDCYLNCLDAAKSNGLRSVAFPCIATRKKQAFSKSEAATIALETVRFWMTQHHTQMDLVVFCVFHQEDLEVYEERMQIYFPAPEPQKPADSVDAPQTSLADSGPEAVTPATPTRTTDELETTAAVATAEVGHAPIKPASSTTLETAPSSVAPQSTSSEPDATEASCSVYENIEFTNGTQQTAYKNTETASDKFLETKELNNNNGATSTKDTSSDETSSTINSYEHKLVPDNTVQFGNTTENKTERVFATHKPTPPPKTFVGTSKTSKGCASSVVETRKLFNRPTETPNVKPQAGFPPPSGSVIEDKTTQGRGTKDSHVSQLVAKFNRPS